MGIVNRSICELRKLLSPVRLPRWRAQTRSKNMSNLALNTVFGHSKTRHAARLVLLALADRANEQGIAWPGTADLMRRTGLSKPSVWKGTKEAEALGELVVERYKGPNRTHRYTVQILNGSDSEPFNHQRSTVKYSNGDGSVFEHKPTRTLKNPHSILASQRRNQSSKKTRESFEEVSKEFSDKGIFTAEELRELRREHAGRLEKLPNKPYPTADNFRRFLEGKVPQAAKQKPKATPLQRAQEHRERWWNQWIQERCPNVGASWEEAGDAERGQFMLTNYGANYRALAEGLPKIQVGELGELKVLP